jgi:hypothetical protein
MNTFLIGMALARARKKDETRLNSRKVVLISGHFFTVLQRYGIQKWGNSGEKCDICR